MAELVWDAVGERLYETGNSQTVLYPMTNNVYGNGVAWNGVTGINHQPSGGDSSDIYAVFITHTNQAIPFIPGTSS